MKLNWRKEVDAHGDEHWKADLWRTHISVSHGATGWSWVLIARAGGEMFSYYSYTTAKGARHGCERALHRMHADLATVFAAADQAKEPEA